MAASESANFSQGVSFSHCLFCLRVLDPVLISELVLGNPKNLKCFQPVLHYLTGTDPSHETSAKVCAREGVPMMDSLPPMCRPCYVVMAELCRLHEQLRDVQWVIQKQTERAREIVMKTRISCGGQPPAKSQFDAWMSSGKTPIEVKGGMCKLVEGLHAKIIREANLNGNVRFSSSPPSHSDEDSKLAVPPADLPETPIVVKVESLYEETMDVDDVNSTSQRGDDHDHDDDVPPPSPTTSTSSSSTATSPPPVRRMRGRKRNLVTSRVTQACDLCGEIVRIEEINEHLRGHGVEAFLTRCLNPACPCIFSCRRKMEVHLTAKGTRARYDTNSMSCRKALKLPPVRKTFRKCEMCSNEVISGVALVRHLQSHESVIKDKRFSCPIQDCSESFSLHQSLEEHIFSHDLRPRKEEQDCPKCGETIQLKDISEHLMQTHEVEEVVSCKHCPFKFPNWDALLAHLNVHSKLGLSCDLCDAHLKMVSYNMLRQHYFKVHQKGKQFLCEHCDKDFYAPTILAKHIKEAHDKDQDRKGRQIKFRERKCPLCPFTTNKGNGDFQTHQIQEHGADPLICRFCDKSFSQVRSWRNHEKEHAGLKRTYKCDAVDCHREFTARKHLTDHKALAHSSCRPFVCELCGKGFAHLTALKGHTKQVHLKTERKRVICEECGESFSCSTTLKNHRLIHTGERPHLCPICGQAFRHRDVMKTHVKSHEKKGDSFKPSGPMKDIRKRVKKETI